MTAQTATREHPIIFSGEMVRAILAGRKTQTRCLAKPPKKAMFLPDDVWKNDIDEPGTAYLDDESGRLRITCPHGQPGDRLVVRETWALVRPWSDPETGYVDEVEEWKGILPPRLPETWRIWYAADGDNIKAHSDDRLVKRWRPPLFMPRWASRITLEITGVRVEHLQQITEEDAIAEGIQRSERTGRYMPGVCDYATWAFRELWDSINSKRAPWDSNPFCWAISFKRIKP